MAHDLIARAVAYDAALAARDFATAAACFAEDAAYVSPGAGGAVRGRAAIRAMFAAFFAHHPDASWRNGEWVQTDDSAVCHAWELTVPGQAVRRGTETSWFDSDGLIRRLETGG